MSDKIDTTNKWMIGVGASRVTIMRAPHILSPDDALLFAAWLVALAPGRSREEFLAVLDAVEAT